MTRLIEKRSVCVTMFVLFAVAIAVNTFAGGSLPQFGAGLFFTGTEQVIADGPVFPPDPWPSDKGKFLKADGPVFPPDPWPSDKGKFLKADGPVFPPDPWPSDKGKFLRADGPVFPPDPWPSDKGKRKQA
jgi:hypothetical protein